MSTSSSPTPTTTPRDELTPEGVALQAALAAYDRTEKIGDEVESWGMTGKHATTMETLMHMTPAGAVATCSECGATSDNTFKCCGTYNYAT